MSQIADALRDFVQDNFLFGDDSPFTDRESFLELGIIDSTGVLELVEFVERKWSLVVEDDELVPENLDSINNLVQFVEHKRQPTPVSN